MSMSSFLWYDVSGSVAADKGRNLKKPLVHMTRGFLVIPKYFSRSAYNSISIENISSISSCLCFPM